MTPQGYLFIGLTAVVAGLLGLLVFAVLRFAAAARDARRTLRATNSETTLLTAALQEALTNLRAQERAMTARAEASERLNTGIVGSLTAGLLVVGLDGVVRIVNPSAERLLGVVPPPELTPSDEGMMPNFYKSKDDLDVPAFLRKQMD